MKTVDIKGKDYVEVNERIKYFRANFKGYSLLTTVVYNYKAELIKIEGEEKLRKKPAEICLKASVINSEGVVVATGLAMEKEDSTFINKTSYIENCETSAWGRALANFGIGIDKTVASADEVKNAIANQSK